MPDTPLIQQIRTASRLMVRELGFMSTTLAATHYSPSAVHTLLEVSMRGEMTAAQLVTLLGLEKSSVSRMVSRLLAAGGWRLVSWRSVLARRMRARNHSP